MEHCPLPKYKIGDIVVHNIISGSIRQDKILAARYEIIKGSEPEYMGWVYYVDVGPIGPRGAIVDANIIYKL